jgi:signal transduction histidine kinase
VSDVLNGRIELESAPGKGTLFRVIFPVDPSPAASTGG